jgi:hypothetical protein
MPMSSARNSSLLSLPAEIRLQIYEHVLGTRTVHVRMKWTGICTPAGFLYSCLEDIQPLLESGESKILAHAVPFGPEIHSLSQTCRQMQEETANLPFKAYTWAFETAFTLDQWVSMKSQIPVQYKNAIRTVAVPTPGVYQSSQRILLSLYKIFLVGTFSPVHTSPALNADSDVPGRAIITLRKDKATDTWIRETKDLLI